VTLDKNHGAYKSAVLGGLDLPRSVEVTSLWTDGTGTLDEKDAEFNRFLTALRVCMADEEEMHFAEEGIARFQGDETQHRVEGVEVAQSQSTNGWPRSKASQKSSRRIVPQTTPRKATQP